MPVRTRPDSSPVPRPAAVPPAGTNVVVLRGTLSRDPELRSLPSGDALLAFEVTVRAADGAAPARAESVPVCWFDPPSAATRLGAGTEVLVVGRVRRRFFRAGGATASRTEVVADRIVPVRAGARCRAALEAALGALHEEG